MSSGAGALVVIAAIAVAVWLRAVLPRVIGDAAERGIRRARAAAARGKPVRFWIVPDTRPVRDLLDAVLQHAEESGSRGVSARATTRKGQVVVECEIETGPEADDLRAGLLRAARKRDPSCALRLP